MTEKNFAIIGAGGYIAPRHMQAIRDTGNRLVAAVDPKDSVGILDRYSFDVRFFTEVERFDRHLEKLRRLGEAERVHYVSICSPNYLHDAHCRLALRVGADAICEKPLVINPWNLDALEEIEAETGRKIHTVLQLRVHPTLLELKARIEQEPPDGLIVMGEAVEEEVGNSFRRLIEADGFRKARDLLAFFIDLAEAPLDRLHRLAEKTRRRCPEVRFRPVRRRTLAADLALIKDVYNEAWEDNWGFVPMTDAEINFMAARFKPLLAEGLVWLAEAPDGPVGFLLALPDYNEALKPLRGRLLTPRLLRALPYLLGWRGTRNCRVLILGVKKAYRGRGLEAVMLAEGFKTGFQLGFKTAEASWVLEDNVAMCRFMQIFGGRVSKTYRLYEREVREA